MLDDKEYDSQIVLPTKEDYKRYCELYFDKYYKSGVHSLSE